MRKVREVLRLRHALSLSYREIGEALGISKTAAGEIVRRAEVIGLSWPLPQLFDDGELERRLFTAAGEAQTERPAPDWAKLHEELKRRSVTLVLLWQEYRAEHPDGYGYSRYVAPRFMLRGVRRARDTGLSPGPRGT
jgi:transposase